MAKDESNIYKSNMKQKYMSYTRVSSHIQRVST